MSNRPNPFKLGNFLVVVQLIVVREPKSPVKQLENCAFYKRDTLYRVEPTPYLSLGLRDRSAAKF